MFKSRFSKALGCVVCLLAIWIGPVQAKFTVIESKVPGYKMGQAIESGAQITLAEGQRLTMIGANGKTVTMRGPYQGPVASGDSTGGDRRSALSALVATRDARTSSVGVIRAGGDAAKLPEPWLIDVGFSSTKCLLEGESPVWWRAESGNQEALDVSPSDRSWRAQYIFPKGGDRIQIGRELPLKSMNVLYLKLGDREVGVQILQVPKVIAQDPVVLTGWMLEKGCVQQASAVIEQIRIDLGQPQR